MEKVKDSLKREFDSKQVYNKNNLKAKIKYHKRKTNVNLYNNKITKLVFQYICLSVILIDSVFRTGKYYYPQVYLEESKFVINKKKIFIFILLMM